MSMTCDEFLEAVKTLITVPSNQSLLDDDQILTFADFENRNTVTPLMESLNQDFFLTPSQRYPLVPNQSRYPIPARAVGRKLRDLALTDSAGGYWSFPLVGLSRGHMINFGEIPYGFRYEGDRIVVLPAPTTTNDFGITFYFSATPGKFVKTAAAAVVDSVNGNDITFTALPPTFSNNRRVDCINGEAGNWFKFIGMKITNITANTVTLDQEIPTDVEPGDYVVLTGESPVIQLPEEAIPLLLNATSKRVLAAYSDFEAKADIEKEIKEQKETVARLMQPRVSSQPIRLVNPYGIGRGRRNMGLLFRD